MEKTIGKDDFFYIDAMDRSEGKDRGVSLMVHEGATGEYSLEIVSYRGEIEPKLPKNQNGFVRKQGKALNLMTINSICKELLEPNLTPKFKVTDIKMTKIKPNQLHGNIEVDLYNSTLEEVIRKLI